ncbi:glycosyltransferase [Peribacillus sp. ACCC06369]|uniref:glycosyltransferase n=1 Tax=Peribacillus sp. ACCC06369 TaxID=3055860 RepID=UPI0025A068EA|nr:glycosyltransferase [Peribacillus sp. ACCC06369]MDM5359870.1 glycosyltransferase [Peribacillus sp. ACCC06369]
MSDKIKVLHLLQSDKFSGAENVACKIIEMFNDDTNFEMAYCSKSGQISDVLQKKGIMYYPMSNLSIREVKRVVDLFEPDIIHAHDASASVISSMLSKRYPILSHMHSNPPWIKKMGKNSILYFISSLRFRNVLTVSSSIMEEYVFGRFLTKKTTIIKNPIDINAIRTKANANNSEKLYDIAYIGRLATPKNPMRFIKLINKLKSNIPHISAVMIGDGVLRKQCKDLIDNLGLNGSITMVGFQENPYSLLEKVKVLCITSKWEGYGLVAVEAMALGRPVVCTPVGGLPMLVNSTCGKICTSDEDFTNELEKLLIDKEYWKGKSNGSIIQANLLDNIPSYKKNIDEIYNKMLGVR